MYIFFPIAEVSVNIFLLLGIGVGVGVLSGMLGVGGGFILTPILMMIGIPPLISVATATNQFVASAAAGTVFHLRAGNVNIRLGILLLAGGLVGSTLGIRVVLYLEEIGNFEFVVKGLYVLLLGSIGILMLTESLRSGKIDDSIPEISEFESKSTLTKIIENMPFKMNFPLMRIRASVIIPLIAGFIVGGLTSIMGVGGGFIMMPILVYLLGVPTLVAVGTSLFQVMIISTYVTIQQAVVNNSVDLPLAMILAIGSVIGVQFGGKLSQRIKSHHIRIILAALLILVTVVMVIDILSPEEKISQSSEINIANTAQVFNSFNSAVLSASREHALIYGFTCTVLALIIGVGVSVIFHSSKSKNK